MDYEQIHNTLAEKYHLNKKQIEHIRSTCLTNHWSKDQYIKMLAAKIQQPRNPKKKPHRSHSKTWYREQIKLLNLLTDNQFQEILSMGN